MKISCMCTFKDVKILLNSAEKPNALLKIATPSRSLPDITEPCQ
jgi:hypothetical protein